ncbi:MAG: hypothetical protein LUM44_11675 [Pyrinomonadaceae bacterium]|nr:hypothetical protein [Pyrinomonadaceae bacterium]
MKSLLKFFCISFFLIISIQAQNVKIKSLVIEPSYPDSNYVSVNGDNISSTSIRGEFDPGWWRCRLPCDSGTEIPLSIVRTSTGIGYLPIRGAADLNIDGVKYDWVVGSLEMIYTVPSVYLNKYYGQRRITFSRNADTQYLRIRLWKRESDFPNAPPILDQTLDMNCMAYLNVERINYWVVNNVTIPKFSTREYKWQCEAR